MEIDFLLRAIIWRHSIGHHSATFGQRALFISYDTEQLHSGHTLHKHFVLNVFVKYVCDNIAFRCTDNRWLQRMLSYGENTVAVCTLLNFFRFLKVGKRPGLTDYVLGLDNISLYGNRRRDISYSHMTRELIWAGFMVNKHTHTHTRIQVYGDHFHSFRLLCVGIARIYIAAGQLSFGEEKVPEFHAFAGVAGRDGNGGKATERAIHVTNKVRLL